MFNDLVVQPLFNLLVTIYALIPGHNFGLSIIIFTIIIRLLLWPLVKKQLHQTKAMRKLQPEIKKIKQATKGDRAKESAMLMELYKERGINPLAAFPTLILQFIVLIGLYSGLHKIIVDPKTIITFAYPFVQSLSWMEHIAKNIHLVDNTLFGVVDLSRAAVNKGGGIYWPAMMIVAGSAVMQYFTAVQLMPKEENQRSLRDILKGAGSGQSADQSEVNAAVGRSTRFLLPIMIFVFTISIASALSLYWLVGGIVAYIQQSIVLNKDEEEMEEIADKPSKNVKKIPEAEVVSKPQPKKKKRR
ncbi:MAG: YidC/Oxa1 family membrane protein insertase [bacterium]|jgi:YidC/Oxa1 family membrane protein insertase